MPRIHPLDPPDPIPPRIVNGFHYLSTSKRGRGGRGGGGHQLHLRDALLEGLDLRGDLLRLLQGSGVLLLQRRQLLPQRPDAVQDVGVVHLGPGLGLPWVGFDGKQFAKAGTEP